MGDKQAERDAMVKAKYGLPEHMVVVHGTNGWAAYGDGVLVVKMSLGKVVLIPLQDLVDVGFTFSWAMGGGRITFNRLHDTSVTRQIIQFRNNGEQAFRSFQQLLEDEKAKGITGDPAPFMPARSGEADQKYRAKYKIPADAVLARSSGMGYVSFDGHYVTLQQVGFGRGIVGKGVKRIPVTAISSVQIKPAALMNGFIQFSLAGSNEVRSTFGRQSWDAMQDENSMSFGADEQPAFMRLRDAIEAAQRALHQPPPVHPAPTPTPDDVFTQLEKLGKLKDAGIITDTEFEAKKNELLDRI